MFVHEFDPARTFVRRQVGSGPTLSPPAGAAGSSPGATLWLVAPFTGGSLAGTALVALARGVPTGPGYSVLLVLHVAAAVVGFGALAVTGVQAARLRRRLDGPALDNIGRYFRPGVNWPARSLYAVPVLGFALLADSGGAFDAGDRWVVAGLVLWALSALAAEVVVWPGERRIQAWFTEGRDDPAAGALLDRLCAQVAFSSAVLAVLFVAAMVVMVSKP